MECKPEMMTISNPDALISNTDELISNHYDPYESNIFKVHVRLIAQQCYCGM